MKYRIPLTFLFLLAIFSCVSCEGYRIINSIQGIEYECVFVEEHNLIVGKYEVSIGEYIQFSNDPSIEVLKDRIRESNREHEWDLYVTDEEYKGYPARISWEKAVIYSQYIGMRLPTFDEWKSLYPYKSGSLKEGNINRDSHFTSYLSGYKIKPVWHNSPNIFGIHNMLGNVSEWVTKQNFSVGTRWNSFAREIDGLQITSHRAYSGFRCVTEINN